MKSIKLSAFILAAVLFLGLGATTAIAQSTEGITLDGKSLNLKNCKGSTGCSCEKCECGTKGGSVCTCTNCACGNTKAPKNAMKCGAGKCGASMAPKKPMKCGAGKCGSSYKAPQKEYERGTIQTH